MKITEKDMGRLKSILRACKINYYVKPIFLPGSTCILCGEEIRVGHPQGDTFTHIFTSAVVTRDWRRTLGVR